MGLVKITVFVCAASVVVCFFCFLKCNDEDSKNIQ